MTARVCFVSCREERVGGPGQLWQLVGRRWRSGGRALPRGDPDGAATCTSPTTVTRQLKSNNDNQESSVWLRGATDESLLPFCVQFEQENQRLVSEMNSLVDEVRSVTSCAAAVSFAFDLRQLAAIIHHGTDVKQRELVNGLQSNCHVI